jgi:uncharacterized membrane protein
MRYSLLFACIVWIVAPAALWAQGAVNFTGVGKQRVEVGERFRIVYEVNGDGSGFTAPNFGSLQVLSGPNTSTSSSIQYINGQVQQNFSKSYTYIVEATREGTVNVSPAKITVDGKTYSSNTIRIEVLKGSGQSQNSGSSQNQSRRDDGVLQDDDVYIRAVVDNRSPYLGEQVLVTYRIYTRIPVSNLMLKKASSFNGFWSKNLTDDNQQLKQSSQIINGEEYIVADIANYAIFPQKTGELTIDPAEMDIVAQLRVQQQRRRSNDPFENFFNDPFFNRNMRNVEVTLKSKPVTINVKPLPEKGKPAGFTGAVGEYNFTSEIDRNELTTNDALTLKVSISGRGNLELIELPEPQFPVDFETYDPKITNNIQTTPSGIRGSKRFEYLAIPRAPGDFTIAPLNFSYFNPKTATYHTFTSGEYTIAVEKGDQSDQGITYSRSAQEDIRFIGKDIRHILGGPYQFVTAGSFFFASTTYYILLVLPVVILILLIIWWKRMEKRHSNVSMMKTRKANKVARSRLQKAEKFKKEGNDKAFYDEIAQALWGYIADKFSIQRAALSIDTVKATLTAKNVPEDVIDNFINTLNNIDFARFAPGDSSGKMENVYAEAMNAITAAEKALK